MDLLPGLRRIPPGQSAPGRHAAAESVRSERYWRPLGIWAELAGKRVASGDELDDGGVGERDGRAGDRGRLAGSRAGMGGLCSADELRHDSDTSATAAADGICRAGESI